LSVGTLMIALLHAVRLGWWVVPMLAFSALCLLLLLAQERRSSEPLLPLGLWRDRTIVAGNIGGLAIGAAMMATSAFLPTYVQAVMGHDAIAGGIMLALLSVGWPIASTLGGRLMLVTSYRTTAVLGGFFLVAGSAMLPLLGQQLVWAGVAATLIGGGMGLCSTTFMVSVQNAASHSMRGIATASTVFMRMLGSSLGTAMLGAVLNFGLAGSVSSSGDPVQTLMDPAKRAALPPEAIEQLTAAVGGALHGVFWAATAFGALAFAAAWLMPAALRPGHAAEGRAAGE
jgi:Na+/melibiose symporter-like transporter